MVRHFHIFWQRGPGILDDTTHRNAWCNSETIEFQHPQQQILSSSLPPSYISMHWLSLPLQCPLRLFLSIINLRSSRSTARTTLFPWWFFEKGLSESGCTNSKYSKRSSRWEQTFKKTWSLSRQNTYWRVLKIPNSLQTASDAEGASHSKIGHTDTVGLSSHIWRGFKIFKSTIDHT